jgi:hypothetical protein
LDEEGNRKAVQGIPRTIIVREISTMKLKKCYRKGCQLFVAHMEEESKDRVQNLEDHSILKYFEDMFKKILEIPQREILISL